LFEFNSLTVTILLLSIVDEQSSVKCKLLLESVCGYIKSWCVKIVHNVLYFCFFHFSNAILNFLRERDSDAIELKSKINMRQSSLVSRPYSAPLLWITKWVDYSDKYGFGYQLSDDSISVSFNDLAGMILLLDGVVGTLSCQGEISSGTSEES